VEGRGGVTMPYVPWKMRLEIVQRYYNKNRMVKTPNGVGFIQKIPESCSGVWGYGGDCISVYVNGNPYKSSDIVRLNEEE
jgi:hypothetical protein